MYANVAYTYNDKYSLTASFRTDASNFQSESQRDKFSPFWSVGASWLLSREGFLSRTDWVNQLKLRLSYGLAGVAAGKKGTSSVTTVGVHPGHLTFTNNESFNTIAARGNETLTWEKSRTFNIGVDVALFSNKLDGSIEFYNKYSYDVLAEATVPEISQGTSSVVFNNAEVLNRGVELSIGTNLPVVGDLWWNGTLNYAFNRNEVKKFDLKTDIPIANPGLIEGYPIDGILALKAVGYAPEGFVILEGKDGTREEVVSMTTSHFMDQIYRQNGETVNSNNWIYYVGTSTPKSNLSFTNMFMWKGFSLSFMITGRFGYYVLRGDALAPLNLSAASYSKQLDESFRVYDKGYGNQTFYSALPLYNDDNYDIYKKEYGYAYTVNINSILTNYYIKGNHIRLNEIYLGYDLPKALLDRQGVFSRVNVYAQASHLGLIWSANKDMDPDYTVGNVKPMPLFTFGLKVNFKNW